MNIRTRAAAVVSGFAIVAAAAPLAIADAQARPEPDPGLTSPAPPYAAQMAQLIDEQHHASTLALRKLIHSEIVLLRIDSRWSDV